MSGAASTARVTSNDIDASGMELFIANTNTSLNTMLVFGLADNSATSNPKYIIESNLINCNFVSKYVLSGDKFGRIFGGSLKGNYRVNGNNIIIRDQILFTGNGTTTSQGMLWSPGYKLAMCNNSISSDRATFVSPTLDTRFFGYVPLLTQSDAIIHNNTLIHDGVGHVINYPQGRISQKHGTRIGVSAGAVAAILIFDRMSGTAAKINTYAASGLSSGELVFNMATAGSATITGTSTLVTAAVTQDYTDTDGVVKTAVTLTAINTLFSSTPLLVQVDCLSRQLSYGVEKIIFPA